ncbi:hypothetical protein BAE44_0026307 [Dichanthelium oligosanthes]|uniref:F-box domain-containing protein n=1 Tax=Dichanthelium oligosanthes TaxID=888268 RepID=A0A1E5UIH4_9POAL|nr:hypothetical protein BAE44_0026307 [Dichanthelium oligosanthes]
MTTTTPPRADPFSRPHGDRLIAEWLTGLNLLWRKKLRQREAMRPQGPAAAASDEALANVFQRLSPRSAAACRAVCLRWSVLLSSPRLTSLADADAAGSSTCFFAGHDGVSAAGQGRRRRGGTMPAAPLFAPLPKHQYRRSRKEQGYRRML